MRLRKLPLFIILGFSLIFILNNTASGRPKAAKDDLYNQIEIFSDAISAIQMEYVDTVPSKDIIYGALKGMLSSLDPYSQFMDQDTYNELQVETVGEFGGLGIEITIKDDLLTIISPLDGTPAHKVGLKALDRIIKINGKITRDMNLTDAVKNMRGKPGTDVTLTIMREGVDELKDYVITRDIINIKSVRKAEILENKIGYIKLTDFSEKTKNDLDEALAMLEKEGMDSLIFDLRNNPGGLLISSVETVSEFLPTGKLIVSTKGRDPNQNAEYRATGKTHFKDIPLIVMINGGSASASEIVAGAIQDHKRGVILGTKSFGKGSVQTVIPLRDGSALRLTTAKYYTPSGRTIHETGVTPDIVVEVEEPKQEVKKEPKKENTIFEKLEQEEKNNNNNTPTDKEPAAVEPAPSPEEPVPAPDPEKKDLMKDDNQLRAAVNLMQGIKIYQGMKTIN
ncbi:MAG: S41 family peptidase [Candidatus Omnitrophica bacterium]|nr:S41 family peptidase [Candidatus Omnitrophota bacterium]